MRLDHNYFLQSVLFTGKQFLKPNSFFPMVAVEMDNNIDTITYDGECQLSYEARKHLHRVASQWTDVPDSKVLRVVRLSGAMTNAVYQITWPTKAGLLDRKVLVRIYGQGVDIFFDRNDEIKTFECMSKQGQGPLLLDRFQTGRIEEFIHARTLSAADMRDSEISALIAAKLSEFHNLDMPGLKKAFIWDRLRNWLKVTKTKALPDVFREFQLDTMDEEISFLETELSRKDQIIGFCHNDLQYGNIMFDEETKTVTLIDYEYSSYNPVAYDFANHFCEMAANYHEGPGHILDFSKYPDHEERKRFIIAYLSSLGKEYSDEEVEQLLSDTEKYTLASHLLWGLWGITSKYINSMIDFDYMEYARQRFQQYHLRKPQLLPCRSI